MYTKIPNGALESRINAIFGICLYLNKAYVQFSLFLKVCLLYHFKYMNAHTWQWIDLSSWPLTNYTSSQSWGLTRLCNARPAPSHPRSLYCKLRKTVQPHCPLHCHSFRNPCFLHVAQNRLGWGMKRTLCVNCTGWLYEKEVRVSNMFYPDLTLRPSPLHCFRWQVCSQQRHSFRKAFQNSPSFPFSAAKEPNTFNT